MHMHKRLFVCIKDVCMYVCTYVFYVHIKMNIVLIKLCNYFKKVFLTDAIIWDIKAFMTAPKSV